MFKRRGWHCWGARKHCYSQFCLILKNAASPCPKAWDSMIALWGHLHRGSRNKCCSRCYLSSAGESLDLHTEMLTFPFLCFPLLFPSPEQDRLVSHCPVCSHWPPRSPLSHSHVTPHGSMHSTPARPQERGGPCTPGPLSTELWGSFVTGKGALIP